MAVLRSFIGAYGVFLHDKSTWTPEMPQSTPIGGELVALLPDGGDRRDIEELHL